MSERKKPFPSTSSATSEAGSTGRPSTSTICKPTRNEGMRRAREQLEAADGIAAFPVNDCVDAVAESERLSQ